MTSTVLAEQQVFFCRVWLEKSLKKSLLKCQKTFHFNYMHHSSLWSAAVTCYTAKCRHAFFFNVENYKASQWSTVVWSGHIENKCIPCALALNSSMDMVWMSPYPQQLFSFPCLKTNNAGVIQNFKLWELWLAVSGLASLSLVSYRLLCRFRV